MTLNSLRKDRVPFIYAFSDGPRSSANDSAVEDVRRMLRGIDWCEVVVCERETNLGLGRSILTGVSDVLKKHDSAIIFEDDLVCTQGTYRYLCAGLEQYRDCPSVMSVTGWTHPLITPHDVSDHPYFDGRAECWGWGTWRRAWEGMGEDAKTLMQRCEAEGIDIYRYGADLPEMAAVELRRNIWAVRFLYWHILNRGLCMRPPWSMVDHIGWDSRGTNAVKAGIWEAAPLKPAPPIPVRWPEPVEHPGCSLLHRTACGGRPTFPGQLGRSIRRFASNVLRSILPK